MEFSELLRLIDERSAAFRAAIAAAPDLDARVPTCPEWTLLDLAQHLGQGRRAWAATVAAGPDAASKSVNADVAPRDGLADWLAESTRQLVDALSEAGPDQGCWTWWGDSQSPSTVAAVARHQLQEISVHTYDAQLTAVGAGEPLPTDVALDGVEDFLFTCCATTSAWPHEPVAVEYHVVEGRSWRVDLSSAGAAVTRGARHTADASATGTASDLVLGFYGRIPFDSLKLDGDRTQFDRLFDWDPSA